MRKGIFIIILLMLASICQADIYKWVDSQGNVHFSDKPHPGSEAVTLPEVQTYSPPPVSTSNQQASSNDDSDDVATYTTFDIIQPTNEETIRNNDGSVNVIVTIKPMLKQGDKLQMVYDGKDMGDPQTSPAFAISGIYRGAHTVAVKLIASDGNVIKTTDTVKFFMHRPRVGMVPNTKPKPKPSN
jgi:hypothetical protein